MTRRPGGALYTPEMLALATRLAQVPPLPDAPLHGEARSPTCGSMLQLDCAVEEGRVEGLGLMVSACAVGQAGAALFADWAKGKSPDDIDSARRSVEAWLAGDGDVPTVPDLSPIASARDYPARHAAILLPWRAFDDALGKADTAR